MERSRNDKRTRQQEPKGPGIAAREGRRKAWGPGERAKEQEIEKSQRKQVNSMLASESPLRLKSGRPCSGSLITSKTRPEDEPAS